MSRSLKKGPFVETRLLDAYHRDERGWQEGRHQDLVSRRPPSSPRWSVTPSPSTTVASTCPCTSPSPWLVTSSASSHRPVRSVATRPNREVHRKWQSNNEVRATAKWVRVSPTQGSPRGRLDSRQVRCPGSRDPAASASVTLPLTSRRFSRSAVANAENNNGMRADEPGCRRPPMLTRARRSSVSVLALRAPLPAF